MKGIVLGAGLLLASTAGAAQAPQGDPKATEQWSPAVPVVTPGAFVGWPAPADAIVLFDGKGLDKWSAVKTGGAAGWTVADGTVTVKKGTGNIQTKQSFGNYQLHLEYRIPAAITGEGQARGNSGLFLASTGPGDDGYELQIMDSYNNPTYVNGQLGAVYKQTPPLANPARKPGEWQTVDVLWTAPQFGADGAVTRPAFVTAHVNGVLVQNHTQVKGGTTYIGQPRYTAHGRAPIKLQDHGDPSAPISFRNIWIRDLKD
ncbi:hypothetical protein ASE95_03460 [Sphingomonas sp. Leaf231]|uniref:3-keto-disaccharide hydrolase n=1 Tax=Sphingomonas sp. Leaf231 TaxID=1736301 RepID=UPI0006FE98A1|nr:DUF1080 domain-containing protein [Sphingomonas sp. Leaf231]KQN93963.1 hypothetical protein ASE95_03460 [Sphingomonas sp. Leaf231]